MSISITDRNSGKLLEAAHKILQSTFVPVRLVACLVGIMVSFFPGVGVLLIPGTGNGERGTGNGSLGTSVQRKSV